MQAQISKTFRIAEVSALLINAEQTMIHNSKQKPLRIPTVDAFSGTSNNEHKQLKRPGCRYQKSIFKIPRARGRPYALMQPILSQT